MRALLGGATTSGGGDRPAHTPPATEGSALPHPVHATPIGSSIREVGMLYAWPLGDERLDEGKARTLALVADRLAAAFDNAVLLRAATQVEALRELDRLKSELLDTVSHELRTPLSLIYGFSELMVDPDTRDRYSRDELLRMAEQVHGGAQIMSRLVDDLLEYARLEKGRVRLDRRPLDLAALLDNELRAFRPQPGGERIRLRTEPELPALVADEPRLRQVIGNLLANALKYAPSGEIELVARGEGDAIVIEVIDHGPGIPDAEKPRVWEKFFRGSARTLGVRGSGIGLAVVRALVEAHGGRIELRDTPGGGATFHLLLPGPASAPRPPASPDEAH
jgi:two-component system sensor histidine kinase KdpD